MIGLFAMFILPSCFTDAKSDDKTSFLTDMLEYEEEQLYDEKILGRFARTVKYSGPCKSIKRNESSSNKMMKSVKHAVSDMPKTVNKSDHSPSIPKHHFSQDSFSTRTQTFGDGFSRRKKLTRIRKDSQTRVKTENIQEAYYNPSQQVVGSDCERATGQEKEKCRKSNKNTHRIKTKLGHSDETKVGVEAGRGELKATVGYEDNHRKKNILKSLSNVEMDEKREGKGSDCIQSDVKTSRTQITTTETAPINPRKKIWLRTLTGEENFSSTDCTVHVALYGERGSVPDWRLDKGGNNHERKRWDEWEGLFGDIGERVEKVGVWLDCGLFKDQWKLREIETRIGEGETDRFTGCWISQKPVTLSPIHVN